MKYLKLGVLCPIKNYSFSKGINYTTTVASDINTTTGTDIILHSIALSGGSNSLKALIGEGDKIKLGESTNSSNEGATEELTITEGCVSEDGLESVIRLKSAPIFKYDIGDSVSGTSDYFPDGWLSEGYTILNSFTGNFYYHPKLNALNLPIGNRDTTGILDFNSFGVDDYSCARFYVFRTTIDSQSVQFLRYNFSEDDILPSTYYKWNLYYKYKTVIGGTNPQFTSYLQASDGASTIISNGTIFTSTITEDKSDWQYATGSAVQTGSSLSSTGWLKIMGSCQAIGYLYYNVDCVFLEHAKGTDDNIDGVYTFTEQPVLGSQRWEQEDFMYRSLLASGTMKYGMKNKRKSSRWIFNCRFETVSNTFFKNLMILLEWQKLGNRLVLHTTEEYDDETNRLPPILVGYLKLENIQKNSWDRNKKDFNFIFQGI